eukprot:c23697_g1_i1 orf=201-524(+)
MFLFFFFLIGRKRRQKEVCSDGISICTGFTGLAMAEAVLQVNAFHCFLKGRGPGRSSTTMACIAPVSGITVTLLHSSSRHPSPELFCFSPSRSLFSLRMPPPSPPPP